MGDYFNPGTMQPQGDPVMMAANYPTQLQNWLDIQKLEQGREGQLLRQLTQQNNTYENNAPVRMAQRQKDISEADLATLLARTKTNNPYAQTMAQGDMGTAMTKNAQGQVAQATIPSTIDKTNQANEVAALEGSARRIQLMSAGSSPMMGEAEWQKIYPTLSPDLQHSLPAHWDPSIPDRVTALKNAVTASPEHSRDMEKQFVSDASKERVAAGNNQATVEAARLRVQAKVKGLMENFQSAKTPQMAIIYGEMLVSDPDVPDNVKDIVRRGVEKARAIWAEQTAKGQIDLGNPTAGTGPIVGGIQDRLGPTGPQQQQPGQAQHSMADLQKMYPGVDPRVLRQKYFEKFHVYPNP